MSESPAIGSYKHLPKRVRIDNAKDDDDNKKNQMDTTSSCILEWLNRDVLHIVMDYLSVNDILSSITVSRKWRCEVLEYLKGSRYCFEHYYCQKLYFVPRFLGLVSTNDFCKSRSTPFDMCHGDFQKFQTNIRNVGPAIVTIILDCLNEKSLKIIARNCPNIKTLMLVGMQEHQAHEPRNLLAPVEQCEMLSFTEDVQQCLEDLQLKRVVFIDCKTITEEYIGEFLKYDSVEELVVSRNTSVEGRCLNFLSHKNLKSLRLVGCAVKDHYLDGVGDRLINLTMLDLSHNSSELMDNVHRLLNRTPNLEYLYLNCFARIEGCNEFADSLCRLSCLKHLSLCWNDNLCDEWLEAVARGCPGLLTLDIETKYSKYRPVRRTVTANGILTLCREASELTHLGIAGHLDVTDAFVAALIDACPKLQSVDLRGCLGVAAGQNGVLTGVKAPQRQGKPLRLRLAHTGAQTNQAQAPQGLIFDYVDAPREFRLV